MSIRLVLSGRVYDADTNGAIAGIVVKAFLNQSTRAVGTATTDQVGSFTMSIEGREGALWSSSAAIRFGLYQLDSKSAFHRTERMRLRDLTNDLAIAVPDAALSGAFEKPVVRLLADGEPSREIDVG